MTNPISGSRSFRSSDTRQGRHATGASTWPGLSGSCFSTVTTRWLPDWSRHTPARCGNVTDSWTWSRPGRCWSFLTEHAARLPFSPPTSWPCSCCTASWPHSAMQSGATSLQPLVAGMPICPDGTTGSWGCDCCWRTLAWHSARTPPWCSSTTMAKTQSRAASSTRVPASGSVPSIWANSTCGSQQ